jgi:hypothetical protein
MTDAEYVRYTQVKDSLVDNIQITRHVTAIQLSEVALTDDRRRGHGAISPAHVSRSLGRVHTILRLWVSGIRKCLIC